MISVKDTMELIPLILILFPRWQDIEGAIALEPSFDVPMVNVTVKAGTTAILPCSVKFLGQHQVVWTDQWSTLLTFEDRRIIDDERLSIERPYTKDWNLHIRKVKHKDEGIYNCQVNTSPVKIKTVNLKVQVPAMIISSLSSGEILVREYETVTLVCNVTGIPIPTVTWYRRSGDGLDEDEKESEFCPGTTRIGMSGEVLIIHNVSRYCSDVYECVAFNGVPPAVNRKIKVSVEFVPEVRLPTRRIGQEVGRETILECVISAYPQEISVWERNGVEISNSLKHRVEIYYEGDHTITLSLRIRNLEESDFGQYTCVASNLLGRDSETMILYDYVAYKRTAPAPTTTAISAATRYNKNWKQIHLTQYPPQFVNGRENHGSIDFITRRPSATQRSRERYYPDTRRKLESRVVSGNSSPHMHPGYWIIISLVMYHVTGSCL